VVAVRFGLALDFVSDELSLDQVIARYVPLIRLAESYGFESVWAGESYTTSPGGGAHLPSPLLALAALAPQVSCRLGTGVTLLPMWQPLKLAYDVAVLDQLSGGRFVLGVGLGNPGTWRRFGVDTADMGTRVDETLELLRALWSGERGYHGQVVSVEHGIAPLPRQPGGPPFWVGGGVRRSAQRAARYGEAWYASTNHGFTLIRRQSARYREALTALGKDARAATVSANRATCLAPTDAAALQDGREYVERVMRRYAAQGSLKLADGHVVRPDEPVLELTREEHCLVGSPETVCARIQDYADLGVTHVQLRVAPGDMPTELVAQTIRLAGEAVLPRFRA
jgi:alkanesulfonate monooxygenase SsuD/methylene tetrahydromethanopterin reductase-like flavin-dependent oxidoreductase (luciferase family)